MSSSVVESRWQGNCEWSNVNVLLTNVTMFGWKRPNWPACWMYEHSSSIDFEDAKMLCICSSLSATWKSLELGRIGQHSSSSDDEPGDWSHCKYSFNVSTISTAELSREPVLLLQVESCALSTSVSMVVKSPQSIIPKLSLLSSGLLSITLKCDSMGGTTLIFFVVCSPDSSR